MAVEILREKGEDHPVLQNRVSYVYPLEYLGVLRTVSHCVSSVFDAVNRASSE